MCTWWWQSECREKQQGHSAELKKKQNGGFWTGVYWGFLIFLTSLLPTTFCVITSFFFVSHCSETAYFIFRIILLAHLFVSLCITGFLLGYLTPIVFFCCSCCTLICWYTDKDILLVHPVAILLLCIIWSNRIFLWIFLLQQICPCFAYDCENFVDIRKMSPISKWRPRRWRSFYIVEWVPEVFLYSRVSPRGLSI